MNLPNQLQCIIFDMDGVIIDSEEIHKKAYYETFISIGVDVSDQLYKTLTGSSTINAFQKLVSHFNLDLNPEELVLIKREKYVNFFENDPTIHLVKGVEEFIKHSFNKGYTLILASSSAMVNIDRVFNRFNLNSYFTAKISGADLKASKPHPEIFIKAAQASGQSKKHCMVIEDSSNGIKAANDAGIFVIGYDSTHSTDQDYSKADKVVSSFSQIHYHSVAELF
jgi:beta-phosphoglucomutase